MSLPSDWTALMARLDETILFGIANRPLPQEVRDLSQNWHIPLSGDDAEAVLELLTVATFLSEGTCSQPVSLPAEEEVRPPPSREWTKEQIENITRMLHFPLAPGWRETAWLLRKKGWQWPEESLPALFELVHQQPEVWAEMRDLWPPLAPWLTNQFGTRHLFFPDDPPSRIKLSPDSWVTFLFRWIHLDPTGALDWLLIHHAAIHPDIWHLWIERHGCDLPHAVLPLLIILTPQQQALPWLQARARCGDPTLATEVRDVVQPMIRMKNDQLDVLLPPGGPAWEWSGMTESRSGFRRKSAFSDLVSCLPPSVWNDWFQLDNHTFYKRVFDSKDAATLVPAIYFQLKNLREPDHCLNFLKIRLLHPDIPLPGPESALSTFVPSIDLAPLVQQAILDSRYRLIPGSPAWNLLVSPHLYWTESLLEAVLQVFQVRPAFSFEAATDEAFVIALAWRGSLGGLLRRAQRDSLRQAFAGPFARLAPYILEVIYCRKAIHQALGTSRTATG